MTPKQSGGLPEATHAGRVIVVDDDDILIKTVTRVLGGAQFAVQPFDNAADALAAVAADETWPDAILSDLQMPVTSGMELLRHVREHWPALPVVMMTAHATAQSAVVAMRLGAYDYLIKPFEHIEEVITTVSRAVERKRLVDHTRMLERKVEANERFQDIVGASGAMRAVFDLIESVAPTDASVLLLGESGTGKELVARAIHSRSPRRGRQLIAVNCSALTETLLESELFGHVRGAFSGATGGRRGLFEEASGGTLFLDEIGDIPPPTQVRLLRVLQEGEVKPVGSNEARKVDVRVIAATHRDLVAGVQAGSFREDLYYRLNVIAIELPPLRERRDDIALLLHHFLMKHSSRYGKSVKRIDPDALEALTGHSWPGNVRELDNAVQRAVVLARGDSVTLDVLPRDLAKKPMAPFDSAVFEAPFPRAKESAIAQFERNYFVSVLARASGNVAEAARLSGLDRANFRRIARRHGLDLSRFRNA